MKVARVNILVLSYIRTGTCTYGSGGRDGSKRMIMVMVMGLIHLIQYDTVYFTFLKRQIELFLVMACSLIISHNL